MDINTLRAGLLVELETLKANYEIELRHAEYLLSQKTPNTSMPQNLTTAALRMATYAAQYEQTQRILASLE